MADYAELVKTLRSCAAGDCIGCPYLNDTCPHNGQMMLQAADAIEVLGEQNTAYLARIEHDRALWTQQWISVEERLPFAEPGNASDAVLVSDGEYVSRAEWFNFEGVGPYWGYAGIGNITHWMPMPEPPKEET